MEKELLIYKGIIVRKDTSDIKTVKEVYEKKGYERSNFKILPGEKWIDMGGCIGAFSCYAAEKGAYVTCFEPIAEHLDLIHKNILNKNLQDKVQVMPAGVGINNSEAFIYEHTKNGNSWRSSFEKQRKGSIPHMVKVIDVKKIIEDDICLKIDIEGSEKQVINEIIKSGQISKVSKLVFEWTFDVNTKTKDFIDVIQNLKKTHNIIGVTENYLKKLSAYEDYPMSWFPACITVFCIRK